VGQSYTVVAVWRGNSYEVDEMQWRVAKHTESGRGTR